MPNYDYECQDCDHHFEVFQSMSEDKLSDCPRCGGTVERLIGPGAGMIFKGSGFYITDYRSDSYQKARKADSSKPVSNKADSKQTDKKSDGSPGGAKPSSASNGGGEKKSSRSSSAPSS